MAAPKVIFLWRLRTLGVRDGAIGSPSLSPRPGRNLGPVVRNEPHLGVSVLPPWGWPRCGRAGKLFSGQEPTFAGLPRRSFGAGDARPGRPLRSFGTELGPWGSLEIRRSH